MKLAIGQINCKVGALRDNTQKMLKWIERAKQEGAHESGIGMTRGCDLADDNNDNRKPTAQKKPSGKFNLDMTC